MSGGAGWTRRARTALHLAGRVWGGSGFALVPHHDGEVLPAMLHACRAYDPDHVITLPEPEDADRRAQDVVAGFCSPYRLQLPREATMPEGPSTTWPDGVDLASGHGMHLLPHATDVGPTLNYLFGSCPADWDGPLAAALADILGQMDVPVPNGTATDLSPDDRDVILARLVGDGAGDLPRAVIASPGPLLSVAAGSIPPSWTRTEVDLFRVTTPRASCEGLLVIGDEAEDLATARLWRLMQEHGWYLPSFDAHQLPLRALHAVAVVAHDLKQRGGGLRVTSASARSDAVTALVEALRAGPMSRITSAADLIHAVAIDDVPWARSALSWVSAEPFDKPHRHAVTVTTTAAGEVRFQHALPPALLPANDDEPPHWHVDITWAAANESPLRGVDGVHLIDGDPEGVPTAWVRRSRSGLTTRAQPLGAVPRGVAPQHRVASPRLQLPSLRSWITARALDLGLDVDTSPAGARAALLASLLGSRQRLVELISGPLLPALRDMVATSRNDRDQFPDGDGKVLRGGRGVLTHRGVLSRCNGPHSADVERDLESALTAGVVQRGFTLHCPHCRAWQFRSLDDVGQRWTCERCFTVQPLESRSWKGRPPEGPQWYFCAHPVLHELLRENGHVPALLAAHLSRGARHLAGRVDVEELVFSQDGVEVAEIDLVAWISSRLVVAEAKSNDQLSSGGGKAREDLQKKCRVAKWLQADELLFATTNGTWTSAALQQIKTVVHDYQWAPAARPQVRLVTGLGVDPHEEVLP